MRLASFDSGRIGVVEGDEIVDVSGAGPFGAGEWPPLAMVRLIARLADAEAPLTLDLAGRPRRPLAEVRLETPIRWPNKVIAFPANFHAHIEEMRPRPVSAFAASGQGFFLKANSSLSGPMDPIVLPDLPDREVHHECELAIIVGRGGRSIPRETAMDHVFGYSCLVDVVIRGKEERVMRKSFDSFCPVGPFIVTADEIADPADIELELTVDGTLRQKANTRDLIVDIPGMIAMASSVMTLEPGDIIASGTPAGVGAIAAGNRLTITVAGVGAMTLDVVQGRAGAHPVWQKPGA
jgi:2-keto-4-pentenoate hydratase/2-oxohepta-3-ene-1,7-dioic acid hydratase in catechol pathway